MIIMILLTSFENMPRPGLLFSQTAHKVKVHSCSPKTKHVSLQLHTTTCNGTGARRPGGTLEYGTARAARAVAVASAPFPKPGSSLQVEACHTSHIVSKHLAL